MRRIWLVALATLLGSVMFRAAPAAAQAVDFKGKRIEFIIPFAAGGGSDVWARFFQPYLEKYLPGNPTVLVKNQPGGTGIAGTNQFHLRAQPDGLTVLGTTGSVQLPYLLDDPRVKYEYKEWTSIMVSPTGGVSYVQPALGLKSADDIEKLKGQKMKYGSQGVSSLDMVAVLAYELLGLDVQVVFGLKGRADGRLAFERGEVGIDYQTTSAYVKNVEPLVKAGKAVPLFAWGVLDEKGDVIRDPTFPNLPSYVEVYEKMHGKKPAGVEWEAYKSFFTAGFAAQKIIVLPKGTPANIVAVWREAIGRVVRDPEFIARSKNELGDYKQAVGPDAATLTNVAINVDPTSKAWIKNWLVTKYNYKPDAD
ncbi:MAG: tricarboxylate transporter [Alphaproteobacteria bacterium]|nr:tricarboxylate transporter [Alphaproteobacteria bacterium]